MIDVVCLGILVADVIVRPVDRLPERGTVGLVDAMVLRGGGSALNTATGLTRLGARAAVAGKVGVDPFGDFLLHLLHERGIDGRGVLRDQHVPSSATVALVDATGERTFLHLLGANGALRLEELDLELVFSGRALHLAGALVMPALDGEPTASLLQLARERGLKTSLDVVYDPSGRWRRILPSLPYLDVIAPSLAEARGISGEQQPDAAAAWFRARGVRDVAIKLGDRGCYVAGDEFEGHIDPIDVRALDGTGAGDAFVAGLLYGRLAGWPLADAARLANACGALATTAIGAAEGMHSLSEAVTLAGLQELAT